MKEGNRMKMYLIVFTIMFLLAGCQPTNKYDQMILDNNKNYTYDDIGQVGDIRYINAIGGTPLQYTKDTALKYWDAWLIHDTKGMDESSDELAPLGLKIKILDKDKGMCKVGVLNASEVYENPDDAPKEIWIMCAYFNAKLN